MARRLLLVLLSLVVLVVLAAGGLLAVLALHPESFKGPVERYLTAQLGRPVTIDGPVALHLGRVATLDASGIKVANPDWAKDRDLADIAHLRLGVDLGAYWRDRSLVLTELRLDQPQLDLERDAQGRTTWPSSSGGGSTSASGTSGSSTRSGGSGLPQIEALTINGGRIAYRDAQSAVDVTSTVATEPPKPGAVHDFGGLKLDGQGQVRGGPASFAFEVGSPLLLTAGTTAPFPLKGRLTLAGTELALDGAVRDPLALKGLDVTFDLASADPTKLLAFLGVPAAQAPPDLGLKARLTREDAAFRLADLDAGWGRSRLTGQLAYDPSAQRPTVTGDLHAPLLDVAALEPVFASGPSGRQGSSSGPAALAAYDGDLKLAADRVRLPQAELRDVAAEVKLAAGRLTVDPLRVGLPQGTLAGRAEAADLTKTPLETAVDLQAQGVDLASLPGLGGRDLAGRFDGTLAGTLRGTDLATLLAQSQATLKGRLDGARYAKVDLRQGDLEAKLAQGRLTVDPLRLALPGGQVTGSVTTGPLAAMLEQKAVDATVDLSAQGLDLAPFVAAGDLQAGRFTGTLSGSLRGGSLDGVLGQSDLALDGRLDGVRYGEAAFRQAAAKARLAQGRLALDPVQLALEKGGQVAGKVTTGPVAAMIDRKALDAAIDLKADGLDLAPFLAGAGTQGEDLGGMLSGVLTGTLKGGQATDLLGQSALRFAGRIDRPMLPRVGDKMGTVSLTLVLQPGVDRPLQIAADSRLADQPLKVEARGGGLQALYAGKGAYPLAVQASLGETKASADGSVTLPFSTDRVEMALKLAGPDPGPVLAKLDMPAVTLPPYALGGLLARRGPVYSLTGINGKVGDSDLAGDLTLRLDGPRPAVSGQLHSKTLDLANLGGMVGATPGTGPGETASAEQRAKAEAKKAQGEVVPSDPLDPQRWRQLDADVRLTADQVKAGEIPLDGFELRTALKDGLLRVDPMTLRLGEGKTTGWVQLDARQAPAKAGLDVDLTALPVARLLERLHLNTSQLGTLSGRARGGVAASGQGFSVKDFLASGDGQVALLMQGGTLNREIVTGLGFDFLQLFATFLGAVPDQVKIACGIADLQLQNGILTTKTLALDTAVADIGGKGDIDFKNSTIDISLVADPKGVVGPSGQTGISIGGTLAKPQVSVNPAVLAARGLLGATLGVFLSPLTQLASQLGIGDAAQNGPCAASPAKPRDQGQTAGQGLEGGLGKALGQGLDLLNQGGRRRGR